MSPSQAPTDSPCQSVHILCLSEGALPTLSTEFFSTRISLHPAREAIVIGIFDIVPIFLL